MTLESDLFFRKKADPEKLAGYGFQRADNTWIYESTLPGCGFSMVFSVHDDGEPEGHLYDAFDHEEYIAHRLPGKKGAFAASVLEEYLDVLKDIAASCFEQSVFAGVQAEKILAQISREFSCVPEITAEKETVRAVFRKRNREFARITEDSEQAVFSVGNREMILDGSVPDEELTAAVRNAYHLAGGERAMWLIPANPKYFDLDHAFSISDELYWKQTASIAPGDIVYIYYGVPFSSIRYRCLVLKTDIPGKEDPTSTIRMETLMRIRKLDFYDGSLADRNFMNQYGVKTVRNQRYMPAELAEAIERIYQGRSKQ